MNLIKQILKIILLFIIGGAIGLLISIILIMLFTDTTVSEILGKMQRVDLLEGLAAAAVGIASLLVSVPLLVILHEGGHLVCGLMSGYRFISFRIFSFTFYPPTWSSERQTFFNRRHRRTMSVISSRPPSRRNPDRLVQHGRSACQYRGSTCCHAAVADRHTSFRE